MVEVEIRNCNKIVQKGTLIRGRLKAGGSGDRAGLGEGRQHLLNGQDFCFCTSTKCHHECFGIRRGLFVYGDHDL